MGFTTAAGSELAISAGIPATQDAAGYAALTYTPIAEIGKIGTVGPSTNKVEWQPLKGAKKKRKGSTDYGSLQPEMAIDEDDAGQALVRTAAAPTNNALYAFRITLPSGAKRYFQATVFSYAEQIDDADSILKAMPMVEIDTPIVKVAAA